MTRRSRIGGTSARRPRARAHELPRETAVVTVESIAAGGDGVARHDGMACFIPRSAPGDAVRVSLTKRARFARGEILEVLTPSPVRTTPRCRHFVADKCGGCQLQHITNDAQRASRSAIVRDAFLRIARREISLPDVSAGPSDWEYRRRLTLTVHRTDDRVVGGLHPYDNPGAVFELCECPITHHALVDVWQHVRQYLSQLPFEPTLRVALRGRDDGRVAVVVVGGRVWRGAEKWGDVVVSHEQVAEVWWEPVDAAARKLASGSQAGTNDIISAEEALAFAQVNAPVAAKLRNYVVQRVVELRPHHVVDAYAGSGIVTAQLAQDRISVTAIEVDERATRRAQERVGNQAHVRIVTDRVETALPEALQQQPDIAIVNPPRSGLEESVPSMLDNATSLRAIVYVSCDPATLARDVARLPRWRVESVQCFDMFPQTSHVETVCVLLPEAA